MKHSRVAHESNLKIDNLYGFLARKHTSMNTGLVPYFILV